MKKYKLINKLRFYVFVFGIIAFTLISSMILNIQNVQGESLIKYDVVIVDSGDTIWEIAKKYNNQHEDLRKFVYQIKKANDIYGDILKPNQKLRIPKAS